jgi:Tfp pilus assembly protein PilW
MKRRNLRGFTLLELLVAVTLTLGIAAVMFTVTSGTLTLWRRTQDNFTTTAQAKLALDFLERDLQAGIFRRDAATTWLAVTVTNSSSGLTNQGWQIATRMKPATAESLQLLPNPANGRNATIAQARFGLSGAWLRLLATNVETSGSFPVAVSYKIARRPVSGTNVSTSNLAEVRYSLFRSAVATDTTFATGNDVLTGYASSSDTAPASRSAASLTNPNTTNDTLLSNVVDFGVWLYVRDSSGALRRIFPADAADLTHTARDPGGAPDANRYPQVADVMVRVLSDDGARQIAAVEQGVVSRPSGYVSDAEWWWAVVEANSSVFVRRVEMKGATE